MDHGENDPRGLRLPLPLSPEAPSAVPYPIHALGPLTEVVVSLAESFQAPIETAAQSVLSVASLATQGLANARTPFGVTCPLSLSFVTVLVPGSRKAYIDKVLLAGIKTYEKENQNELVRKLEESENADNASVNRDVEAISIGCLHSVSAPDFNHVLNNLANFPGSLTYESGELSNLIGKNSSAKIKSRLGSNFENLWSGEDLLLARGRAVHLLRGRRVTFNFHVEASIASELLKTNHSVSNSIISRSLVSWPATVVGKRKINNFAVEAISGLNSFQERAVSLLRLLPKADQQNFNELSPRTLVLSDEANSMLIDFLGNIEEHSKRNAYFTSILSFSENAAEHICRLAGVLSIFNDERTNHIDKSSLENALILFTYYTLEMQRFQEICTVNESISDAQRLLEWMQDQTRKLYDNDGISGLTVRYVLQHAHPTLRQKKRLDRAIKVLVDHDWVYTRRDNKEIVLKLDIDRER